MHRMGLSAALPAALAKEASSSEKGLRMSKLCLSCMRRIPTLASRCPHCIKDGQSVLGRLILLLIAVIALILLARKYG